MVIQSPIIGNTTNASPLVARYNPGIPSTTMGYGQYQKNHPAKLNMDVSEFDGKRLRKTMMRKTVDYNSSFIMMLQNRTWQRDFRDRRALQPDICYYPYMLPSSALLDNPINAVTTRFVKTATNKMRCPIFCLAWTPEGRRMITGASSGEFTLWNGLTFNFETILQAHDSPVRAMRWSHNDMWMVTGDHEGYVKYWQSNMNNVKMYQAHSHKEPIRSVSFSPSDEKFATCSDDGSVRIWDFHRCYEENVLRGHGSEVKCVDWHPQKGLLVSGSKDTQQPIKLWEPKSGKVLATLHAHKSTVMAVEWNKNGNWLITASRDHLLKLFDIRNLKEEMQTFRGHKKEASAVAWHPIHEGLLASGGSDGSIMFWNVGADKEVGVIEQAHESIVWSLAWHPVGHILCSGSNDHSSKYWTRNRPGDQMRDKYNLNTLGPGQSEEDYVPASNEKEVAATPVSTVIPGMAPEDRVEGIGSIFTSSNNSGAIPGLDFEGVLPDGLSEPKKKMPYAKPIPKAFVNSWNDPKPGVEELRGQKRKYAESDLPMGNGRHATSSVDLSSSHQNRLLPKDAKRGSSGSIQLFQLQNEAVAIVCAGRIVPVVRGEPLFNAIEGGEIAIQNLLVNPDAKNAQKSHGLLRNANDNQKFPSSSGSQENQRIRFSDSNPRGRVFRSRFEPKGNVGNGPAGHGYNDSSAPENHSGEYSGDFKNAPSLKDNDKNFNESSSGDFNENKRGRGGGQRNNNNNNRRRPSSFRSRGGRHH